MQRLTFTTVFAVLLTSSSQAQVMPGDLLLTEGDFGTVVEIGAGGDFSAAPRFASGLEGPIDLCLGPGDDVYVLEQGSGEVTIITAGGDFTGATPFAFGLPSPPSFTFSLSCTASEVLVGGSGEVFDVTAGGDFTGATPFATGLGTNAVFLHRSESGTLWSNSGLTEIVDITGGGDFTGATPFVFNGSGIRRTDRANVNLVSDRAGDSIRDYTAGGDFQSLPVFAQTPSPSALLDAGAFGLFALSSSNDAVFEVSAGGNLLADPPFASGLDRVSAVEGMLYIPLPEPAGAGLVGVILLGGLDARRRSRSPDRDAT